MSGITWEPTLPLEQGVLLTICLAGNADTRDSDGCGKSTWVRDSGLTTI